MSLTPFKGRCIHCGHDHGDNSFEQQGVQFPVMLDAERSKYVLREVKYQETIKQRAEEIAELKRFRELDTKQIAYLIEERGMWMEVAKKMAEALKDVIKANGYESGTPVEALAAYRELIKE